MPLYIQPVNSREQITANRTYYVRTDGNDSNNGLTNTAGGAFLTIQKGIDTIAALDISVLTVTLQVGDGTYTAAVNLKDPVGDGTCVLQGNTTTPSSVVISTTSTDGITSTGTLKWTIKGFKVQTTTSGMCILSQGGGRVVLSGVNFGPAGVSHIRSFQGSQVNITESYSILGGGNDHYLAQQHGRILMVPSKVIDLTGTASFVAAFCRTGLMGYVENYSTTFVGSIAGTRYSASSNSVMNVNGGGANYYPGNVAGSTGTGAQYL